MRGRFELSGAKGDSLSYGVRHVKRWPSLGARFVLFWDWLTVSWNQVLALSSPPCYPEYPCTDKPLPFHSPPRDRPPCYGAHQHPPSLLPAGVASQKRDTLMRPPTPRCLHAGAYLAAMQQLRDYVCPPVLLAGDGRPQRHNRHTGELCRQRTASRPLLGQGHCRPCGRCAVLRACRATPSSRQDDTSLTFGQSSTCHSPLACFSLTGCLVYSK